jgi:hypothetical protein
LLVIGSALDEAWQVLHHVCTLDNPKAVASGLLAYLRWSVGSATLQSAMIARIHGAKSYSDLAWTGKLATLFVQFLSVIVVITLSFIFFLEFVVPDASAGWAFVFLLSFSYIVLWFLIVMGVAVRQIGVP